MEDPDQKSTYAAEDLVAAWVDAASAETGEVQVTVLRDGARRTVTYVPETEPRFGKPADVVVFVDRVLDRLRRQGKEFGSHYRGREQRPVQVVRSRGAKKASYRDGFVVLPERERGGAWALRGLVVLHELAHHLNTGDGAIIDHHGEGFRATFVQLLEDIGWTLNAGNAVIDGCDTGIDVVNDVGIILGANVQATSNVCLIGATKRGDYQSCMDAYKDRLVAGGLITGKQGGRLMSCAAKIFK